jgi:hypothetical protein
MSARRATRLTLKIMNSSYLQTDPPAASLGFRARRWLAETIFISALTISSRIVDGPKLRLKSLREDFYLHLGLSTQMEAFRVAGEKRRGNESSLPGPEPASRESRSYRESNGTEYNYWYNQF